MVNKKKISITLGISLAVILLIVAVVIMISQNSRLQTASPSPSPTVKSTPSVSPEPPIPNPNLTYSAWIPDWDSKDGVVSVEKLAGQLDMISPVWYEVRPDGSLINKRPVNAKQFADAASKNSSQLMPAIAMMDHEIFSQVLAKPENMERHISAIMSEIKINNYDGIDLDYESTKLTDKEAYFSFISDLANRLHQDSKKLIITVLAKWGEDVVYPSLKETRQVQDWSELSKYADNIRIMAYDYTFSKSDKPGPIGPISWIKQILDYAITQIPRAKIILGIHLYSYEWWQELPVKSSDPTDLLDFTPNADLNTAVRNISVRSYTYNTVKTVLQNYKGTLTEFEGEKIYSYTAKNKQTNKQENRVLVFIDSKGVQARTDLAKQYGIEGVTFWRLGGENELLGSIG